jgi:hypothetical protein
MWLPSNVGSGSCRLWGKWSFWKAHEVNQSATGQHRGIDMRIEVVLFLALAALGVANAQVIRDKAECNGLLQPAIVNATSRDSTSLAFISAFNSTLVSASDANQSLGVSYAGIGFNFDSQTVDRLRKEISSKFQYDYRSVADRTYLASFLTKDQLDAFVKCHQYGDNNAHAELYWHDALGVSPDGKKTRTINVILLFKGNNEINKYTLGLTIDKKKSDQLPDTWSNVWATQGFTIRTEKLYDPIAVVANFSTGATPRANASIIIPPILPSVKSHVVQTPRRSEIVGGYCKGPSMESFTTNPVYTTPGAISYFTNPVVQEYPSGEAHPPSNSKVFVTISNNRQQFNTSAICQGISANGDAQMVGYGIATEVTLVVDGVEK